MIIGVYGPIGAGKSTLCHYLAENYHYDYLSADQIAQTVMVSEIVLAFFTKHYPAVVIDEGYDKAQLRQLLFTNQTAAKKIRDFLWPLVGDKITEIITASQNKNIVIEAVAFKDLKIILDYTIFITAPTETLFKRVEERNTIWTPAEINSLLTIQAELFTSEKYDFKIINNTFEQELFKKIDQIMVKMEGNN
ncbi:dephospho-CoA kinase [Spiroplasma syrphidicola EA-1]|uniref:Dephospho-CoA kinase n=1 Tax=Spiroplasma syrphidicola EA-1 TaxID=1276229 RepID=R4UM90_9MOLU|nr:dephospho-CoA kinase [Spiroplasma syrphidicola]AGM26351.1 dephospho-CoA kinase [Spiroplasma syrphidicola EA-1]